MLEGCLKGARMVLQWYIDNDDEGNDDDDDDVWNDCGCILLKIGA